MKLTKNRLLTGGAFTILGILTAIGPQTIFAVCDAMDGKFMKCHWTAQAELGNGAIIAILGFLLFLSSHKIRVGLQIALLALSVQTILLPNVLIGVCGGNHMSCRSLTLPALNVIGAISIIIG
ncbi:MAG: DUF4418 family protein, partial [Lachnospiraceae bacterium]|nr:DUF4418 family protein [Lachnospiraceae bacterium]